jgi:hypothetical protein
MVGCPVSHRSVAPTTMFAGLVLTGCASATGPTSSRIMGGGSDYHYSRLTCLAPNALPGPIVSVTLDDVGMTQMMSGTAPLDSHMMLRATPATEPAGKISLVASHMRWRTHELVILPPAAAAAGQRLPGLTAALDTLPTREPS